MKRRIVAVAAAALLLGAGGCGGPNKLTRQMDRWTNQLYVDNPWLAGNTLSVLLFNAFFVVTRIYDGLVVNPLDFWAVSAWPFGKQGYGTPFIGKNPVVPAPR